MVCRCEEIKNCNDDIAKIKEIQSTLLNLMDENAELRKVYKDLSNKTNETFTTINMKSLQEAEKRLNHDISFKLDCMISKCNLRLINLGDNYIKLKAEDKLFHKLEEVKTVVKDNLPIF